MCTLNIVSQRPSREECTWRGDTHSIGVSVTKEELFIIVCLCLTGRFSSL